MSDQQINNSTPVITQIAELRQMAASSAKYRNIVLNGIAVNHSLISLIADIKKNNCRLEITLLVNYHDILFAKKLLQAGCINNFHLLPLSREEICLIIANRLSPLIPPTAGTLEQRIRELEPAVYTDSLTRLYNRDFINLFLKHIAVNSWGTEVKLSLLLFDIDNLKQYNDLYGHPAGDKLLVNTASAMQRSFRTQDLIARIGGDEFAVILWDIPAVCNDTTSERRNTVRILQSPEDIASRFCNVMAQGKTTISGSITHFSNNIDNLNAILETGDRKLYQAKKAGKNMILK